MLLMHQSCHTSYQVSNSSFNPFITIPFKYMVYLLLIAMVVVAANVNANFMLASMRC